MAKKFHIGNGGTPYCARGLSLNRSTRAKPAKTMTKADFLALPREQQCERCRKNHEASTDTSDFAAGLSRFLGLS